MAVLLSSNKAVTTTTAAASTKKKEEEEEEDEEEELKSKVDKEDTIIKVGINFFLSPAGEIFWYLEKMVRQ